jgi:hypothetical protein
VAVPERDGVEKFNSSSVCRVEVAAHIGQKTGNKPEAMARYLRTDEQYRMHTPSGVVTRVTHSRAPRFGKKKIDELLQAPLVS